MSQKPQNNFWVIFLTIVTIAVLLTLVSCNGSKKAKSSSKTETITVFVRDTVHVKVVDTTKLTTELQEFVTKTIEIFDTTYTEVPQIRQRIIYENIKRENGISKDSTTARTNFAQSETVATNSQTKETKRTPWYLILGIVFIVLFYMTGKKYNVLR
jgi:ribosomal protein S18